MVRDTLNKYIWLIDTINSYGAITLRHLSQLWQNSHLGDGNPLPRRTFFAMRQAIEEKFGVSIKVNKAFEYYIDKEGTLADAALRDWMLDSSAMQDLLADNRDLSPRIHIEPVPSARQFLPAVIRAMKQNLRITFSYASFTRVLPDKDILFEPYFVKLFRQRWYMVGRRVSDREIRTYALDRITEITGTSQTFSIPESLSAESYFADLFGIAQSHAETADITLKTTLEQAKYLRALPLHASQREEMFSSFSLFHYRMKLTRDLISHLVSLGPEVKVLEPRALQVMVKEQLKETLALYENE